jgi:hypothetical protein
MDKALSQSLMAYKAVNDAYEANESFKAQF